MDANKSLDEVLEKLVDAMFLLSYDETADKTKANMNIIKFKDLQLVLNKLVKDGYVEAMMQKKVNLNTKEEVDEMCYRLTFEGKVFIQNKGYSRQYELESIKIRTLQIYEATRKRNDCLLILGTVGAAVFAAFLLFWDMYKTLYLGK